MATPSPSEESVITPTPSTEEAVVDTPSSSLPSTATTAAAPTEPPATTEEEPADTPAAAAPAATEPIASNTTKPDVEPNAPASATSRAPKATTPAPADTGVKSPGASKRTMAGQSTSDPIAKALTKEDLEAFKPEPASGKIPTAQQRADIMTELIKIGCNADAAAQALTSFALEAFDKGATDSTTFSGKYNSVEHKSIASAIKKADVPIHKLCYYYAKPVFAIKQRANQPPAMWASKEIPEAYKWCCFDFFEGLYDPSTLDSALPFSPPNEETRMAYAVYKTVQLTKANSRRGNFLSFNPNVTAARLPSVETMPALPAPQ